MDLSRSGGRSQTPALPHHPEPEALEDLQAPQRGPGSLSPGGGTAGQRCLPPPSCPQPRSALRAAGVRAAAAGWVPPRCRHRRFKAPKQAGGSRQPGSSEDTAPVLRNPRAAGTSSSRYRS